MKEISQAAIGRNWEYLVIISPCTTREMVQCYLKVNLDKIKMYIANSRASTIFNTIVMLIKAIKMESYKMPNKNQKREKRGRGRNNKKSNKY